MEDSFQNPIVTIEMETGDKLEVELYPETAPNTVKNFLKLCGEGFYDGLTFHRVIRGFMIQGGCPNKNGTGNPGYSIKGEFSKNGFQNSLRHDKGVISMARSQHPDSAGSQFFIMHEKSPHLDGQYAAFGKVVSDTALIDKLASVETDFRDAPAIPLVIKSVTADTKGVSYGPPDVISK